MRDINCVFCYNNDRCKPHMQRQKQLPAYAGSRYSLYLADKMNFKKMETTTPLMYENSYALYWGYDRFLIGHIEKYGQH